MIKGTKEVFESQASEYFKWIPKRKAYEQEESSKSLNILKKKVKERKKRKMRCKVCEIITEWTSVILWKS